MNSPPTLPDPDRLPQADVVIFDGQCRFCRTQVQRLRWLDGRGRRLAFLSLHDPRVAQRYPELTHEQMMEQMYVIERDGTAHGGSAAVRYLSRQLPWLWAAMPILHLPGTAGLWRWLYRQVAKRRYRLAGKACEGDACSVHLR
ncbi:thiol-disulfide oxidoreductase DCC family protein [Roseimaritima ulvae]|uniref:Thiol-disulfide oxidoreductase n=1 Tax=Roseimaritima ulvae TaxID=980254 RepID=A0A5B9QP48_9BACT|nr:DUF393 domain-containing protein [Roseimaritima ulvae]QEG39672.1 hypothetical protein UC8_16680 [Roseimaritima ulvae]